MNPTIANLIALGKAAATLAAPQTAAAITLIDAVRGMYDDVKSTANLSAAEVKTLETQRDQFEADVLAEGQRLSDRLSG